ncbi:hypothetical protein EGR_09063 [Echinococcus granulosus]|uniref:Uncharacterized protein n=1 Tax=Echinococcus granulosus TaxID=6210 RepID=W6U4L1_ECHGR|nr:hypothetical protein EGR_09063 [Echinococcus granulosus]EUB56073.1 hypothetical protein EGR_09063 [Echinococcus granulosus]
MDGNEERERRRRERKKGYTYGTAQFLLDNKQEGNVQHVHHHSSPPPAPPPAPPLTPPPTLSILSASPLLCTPPTDPIFNVPSLPKYPSEYPAVLLFILVGNPFGLSNIFPNPPCSRLTSVRRAINQSYICLQLQVCFIFSQGRLVALTPQTMV